MGAISEDLKNVLLGPKLKTNKQKNQHRKQPSAGLQTE